VAAVSPTFAERAVAGLDFRIIVETTDKAPGFTPDLDDPATVGCLLALV
jgi:hypothetical protein